MTKIIAKPRHKDFEWGIYGFCSFTGWEDFDLYREDGTFLCTICVNAKDYNTLHNQ